jgi:hypothetical protein
MTPDGTKRELLSALRELRSAAVQFRQSAYDRAPTLVVSNEAVNMLTAALFVADKLIARQEAMSDDVQALLARVADDATTRPRLAEECRHMHAVLMTLNITTYEDAMMLMLGVLAGTKDRASKLEALLIQARGEIQ